MSSNHPTRNCLFGVASSHPHINIDREHTHTSAVAFSATMRTTLLIAVCAVAFAALAGVRAEEDAADSDVLVVTDATMNKVLEANADSGVLLEFYAPWCVCQPEGNVARRGVGLR